MVLRRGLHTIRPELRELPSRMIQQQSGEDEEPREEQKVQAEEVVNPAVPHEKRAGGAALPALR